MHPVDTPFTTDEEKTLMRRHCDHKPNTESRSRSLSPPQTQTFPSSGPFVIKNNLYPDLAQKCRQELQHLYTSSLQFDSNVQMQMAAMGTKQPSALRNTTSTSTTTPLPSPEWRNSQYRNDQMLWITPELCQQHQLTHVMILIKRLIKTCSHLRKTHLPLENQLALTDFSVQFAVYVSSLN